MLHKYTIFTLAIFVISIRMAQTTLPSGYGFAVNWMTMDTNFVNPPCEHDFDSAFNCYHGGVYWNYGKPYGNAATFLANTKSKIIVASGRWDTSLLNTFADTQWVGSIDQYSQAQRIKYDAVIQQRTNDWFTHNYFHGRNYSIGSPDKHGLIQRIGFSAIRRAAAWECIPT